MQSLTPHHAHSPPPAQALAGDQASLVARAQALRRELHEWHARAGGAVGAHVEELRGIQAELRAQMAGVRAEVDASRRRVEDALFEAEGLATPAPRRGAAAARY